MSDYPFFIPQVVLFANSSLFWFKVANEHREFRNYLLFIRLNVIKKLKMKMAIYQKAVIVPLYVYNDSF